jgi:hypothetical protein
MRSLETTRTAQVKSLKRQDNLLYFISHEWDHLIPLLEIWSFWLWPRIQEVFARFFVAIYRIEAMLPYRFCRGVATPEWLMDRVIQRNFFNGASMVPVSHIFGGSTIRHNVLRHSVGESMLLVLLYSGGVLFRSLPVLFIAADWWYDHSIFDFLNSITTGLK